MSPLSFIKQRRTSRFQSERLILLNNKQSRLSFVPSKMDQNTGKYIIIFGAIVVILGLLIYFLHDKLNWLGHLPGDIRVEKKNFRFYFPITTMIVLSVLLTVIINLIRRFL